LEELQLVSIGALPKGILQHLAEFLEPLIEVPCHASPLVIDPAGAYERHRGQYDCRRLFPVLEDLVHRSQIHVLAVADVDLFSAIFTFVFGESRLGGEVAMMSLHRLRQELYGLPEDRQLLHDRAEREALHEVGHLLGLVHCKHPDCVMRFSGSVEEVDLKSSRFCPTCEAQRNKLRTAPGP
jgi:archaemetzincin